MTTPFPFQAGAVLQAAQLNAITELVTNTQTDDYTLAATDAGDRVIANKATAITFTVPNSVFTAAQIVRVHNIGAGTLTLSAGAGLTLNGADVLTLSQYQGGEIFFTSASSAIFFPTAKTVSSGVVQVKSATKTDTFSMASTTFADVTDLSIAITPTSASNKVLVLATIGNGTTDGWAANFRLMRDSTAIGVGAAAGSRTQTTVSDSGSTNSSLMRVASVVFLDSPNTTSATTYKVQAAQQDSTTPTVFVNRTPDDTNAASRVRTISTITVMEVAP